LLLRDPSSGSTEKVAAWRLNLFRTAVYGFLAPYTELSPRHRDKPFRGDVVITLLAYPEAAFLRTAEGRPDVSQMTKVPVEITDSECTFRCLLDFFQLFGASFNSDSVALADKLLQLNNPGVQDSLKTAQFSLCHRCLLLLAVRFEEAGSTQWIQAGRDSRRVYRDRALGPSNQLHSYGPSRPLRLHNALWAVFNV
jgi:hypothetical protein